MTALGWREDVLTFDCCGTPLVGVVSLPLSAKHTGLVIVVGGPQYRVGSHRQFVRLARRMAAQGYPVLRFDYRGMGDAAGGLRTFEDIEPDIGAAIDALTHFVPSVRRVVLWGLCDGASAALLYSQRTADARIAGMLLLNPWIRTQASQAKTRMRHYYLDRLRQREFWIKLLSGRVAAGAIRAFMGNVKAATVSAAAAKPGGGAYPSRMAQGWQSFKGQGMLILSDQDYTAREFEAYCAADATWSEVMKARPWKRIKLEQADHTCSQPLAEQALHRATLDFLQGVSS